MVEVLALNLLPPFHVVQAVLDGQALKAGQNSQSQAVLTTGRACRQATRAELAAALFQARRDGQG